MGRQSKALIAKYVYTMPESGHPRHATGAKLRRARWYWFQLFHKDGTCKLIRKELTWPGVCNFGDALFSRDRENDVLFAIDGRVPATELDPPPTEAIWSRWEFETFKVDGKPAIKVQMPIVR